MGSGGMIVMDEDNCMVDIAKYYTAFNLDESCGKCSTCREGTRRMLQVLEKISAGKAAEADLELLRQLAKVVKNSSLCGLGKTAPNPTLTTLEYFLEEYEAHLRGECPARVCKALIRYSIDDDKCTGCHLCFKRCPAEAVSGELKQKHSIDTAKCIKCGACFEACRFDAVVKSTGAATEAAEGAGAESTPDGNPTEPTHSSSPGTGADETGDAADTNEGGGPGE